MPASNIRLIVTDVDGVWTDGSIVYQGDGHEIKAFNVRDGLGVKIAQKAGIIIAAVTSRRSPALERRCRELEIIHLVQGAASKLAEMRKLAATLEVPLDDVCYIGDDLPDLAAMSAAGFSAAPSDATAEVRRVATLTLESRGGRGALRELVELILRERGDWDRIVSEFSRESVAVPNV
ncbi:MAG TPA: HAD hydrolase family protein [Thermoanaerobaculia bacterium]|nr:HAD hydrolase family protein [Thermoanaerobaculia bacterium]